VTEHSTQSRLRAGQEGTPEGLVFNPWPPDKTLPSSSLPALEAAKCAQLQGETAFKLYDMALFKAYFQDCVDIGDREVLVQVAGEMGLGVTRFVSDLESGSQRPNVMAEFQECAKMFGPIAQGVPFHIFNDGPPVAGCLPMDVYRQAILRRLQPVGFNRYAWGPAFE